MLLIGNGRVVTRDAQAPYFSDGAVAVSGETIATVGPLAQLQEAYPQAEFLDARGGVIMPGLINAHTHIYSALARGLSLRGYHPATFRQVLEGMWWTIDRKLDADATRKSAVATILDCLRMGVTTIFDHHASYGEIPGSLFAIAEEARRLGMRCCLCYEVSDRDGAQKCAEAIRENGEFARYAAKDPSDMVKAMFGLHAPFTLSDATLDRCVRENDGVTGFHVHVSEGMDDVYDSLRNHGRRPVQRLQDHGILGPKTIAGHCIHVNPAEMEILCQTETMVVNNPQSNMSNAVGVSPVLQLLAKGVLVGLGTDAYTHDMLESAKAALCVQRLNACLPDVAFGETAQMLFVNNARIAARYFQKPLGVLRPGAAADVIVMDYKPYTPFDAHNVDGHMLFGMSGRQCRTTVVNGKVLYRDGAFTLVDEEAESAAICETAQALWGRLNG